MIANNLTMKVILVTTIVVFLAYPIPKGKYLGSMNGHRISLDFSKDSCYITIVDRLVEKWSAKFISQDSIIKIIEPNKDPLYGDRFIVHKNSNYYSLVPCQMIYKKETITVLSMYDTLGRKEIKLDQSEIIYFKKNG